MCLGGRGRGLSPRSPNPPPQGCPGGPNFLLGFPPLGYRCGLWGGGQNFARGSPLWVEGGGLSIALTPPTTSPTPPPTSLTPRVSASAKVSAPSNDDTSKTSWPLQALAPSNQVSTSNDIHVGEGLPPPGDGFNPAAPEWVHTLTLTFRSSKISTPSYIDVLPRA